MPSYFLLSHSSRRCPQPSSSSASSSLSRDLKTTVYFSSRTSSRVLVSVNLNSNDTGVAAESWISHCNRCEAGQLCRAAIGREACHVTGALTSSILTQRDVILRDVRSIAATARRSACGSDPQEYKDQRTVHEPAIPWGFPVQPPNGLLVMPRPDRQSCRLSR